MKNVHSSDLLAGSRRWAFALALAVLWTGSAAFAQLTAETAPHEWCDALLPTSVIEDVAGDFAGRIERRTSSLVEETEGRCTRTYSVDGQRLTDDLVLLVTPASSADAAVTNVRWIGDDAAGYDSTVHHEWLDEVVEIARRIAAVLGS